MLQAKLARTFRHLRSEGAFRTGNALGKRDRGVISGDDDQAANKILDSYAAVDRREHCGSARRRAAVPPSRLADDELIVEMQMAEAKFVKHDFSGHDLRSRRRDNERIGVLFEQNAACGRIDQYRMRRAGLKRLLRKGW